MSFAIFQTGGKQYKVIASKILKIEKVNKKAEKKIKLKMVLQQEIKKVFEMARQKNLTPEFELKIV